MNNKTRNSDLGTWAESYAAELLENKGYQILARNFHSRFGEIDLIALLNKELVFVEVKARSNQTRGSAVDMITLSKQKKVFKTACVYLQQNEQFERLYYRFDVFCFDFHTKISKNLQQNFSDLSYDLEWIENAFTLNVDLINL